MRQRRSSPARASKTTSARARFHNSSSILNGIPYYYLREPERRAYRYRHMLLDPILLTKSIHIYLEGASDQLKNPIKRKFAQRSSSFNQTILPDSLLTTVMFYGSKGPGGITTDRLDYGDSSSTAIHNVLYPERSLSTTFSIHNVLSRSKTSLVSTSKGGSFL